MGPSWQPIDKSKESISSFPLPVLIVAEHYDPVCLSKKSMIPSKWNLIADPGDS